MRLHALNRRHSAQYQPDVRDKEEGGKEEEKACAVMGECYILVHFGQEKENRERERESGHKNGDGDIQGNEDNFLGVDVYLR